MSLPSLGVAQDAGFADDFSSDSITYTTQSFDGSGPASARGEPGAIVMEASSAAGSQGVRDLRLYPIGDRLSVTASIEPTLALAADGSSGVDFGVRGVLFNDLAAGGDGSGSGVGNVSVNVGVSAQGDGTLAAYACVGRDGPDGFESYPAFDDDLNCADFGIAVTPGTSVTYGYSFDRASGTLTVSIDDESRTGTLAGPFNRAADPETSIALGVSNETFAAARISSITTASGTVDFAGTTPVVDRYAAQFFSDERPGSATVIDGRARLERDSLNQGFNSVELAPRQQNDHIEAVLELSSASDIGSGGIDAGLESEWFNDTSDGGFDGRTGDVRATISLRARTDGLREVEYCLTRSNDAEFDDRSGLLDDGGRCARFPTRVELDTPYRAAITLDRDASIITFRFDGFQHVQTLAGVFDGSRPVGFVYVSADAGASVVGFVDDLRTSPSALTPTEAAAGVTMPAAFPEPVDPATLAVDDTISAPYDFNRDVSFVDDFEADGAGALGFWGGSRQGRGETGVTFADGAIELQTNSRDTSEPDNSNYAEIYVNGPSDRLQADVSLRSDSRLPPDPNADAQISIRAVFFNDVQDGGADGREGDVSIQVQLQLRGDGRMRVSVNTNRRLADGSDERYNVIDGENFFQFDDLTPALDAVYRLAVEIDRDQGLLVASVDERRLEIPLPTQAFQAAEAFTLVTVNHRGTSGRAIGWVHAIETDTFSRDFADGPGIIAPYAPHFSTRAPGRDITIAGGRARLSNVALTDDDQDTILFIAGGSDFTGADVTLSAESVFATGGEVRVGVGASLYNDLSAEGGSEGRTYAEMLLVAAADGGRYVQYCAFRSNDAQFDDTVELIAGNGDECGRFDLAIALDTSYPMSIELDRERAALVYTVGPETREYAITTDILDPGRPFNGAIVRATGGSTGVGYFDNLAFSSMPVALADSGELLASDTGRTDNAGTGDGGASAPTADTGGGSGSSGGGGGCSIAGDARGSLALSLLFGVATIGLFRRRRRR